MTHMVWFLRLFVGCRLSTPALCHHIRRNRALATAFALVVMLLNYVVYRLYVQPGTVSEPEPEIQSKPGSSKQPHSASSSSPSLDYLIAPAQLALDCDARRWSVVSWHSQIMLLLFMIPLSGTYLDWVRHTIIYALRACQVWTMYCMVYCLLSLNDSETSTITASAHAVVKYCLSHAMCFALTSTHEKLGAAQGCGCLSRRRVCDRDLPNVCLCWYPPLHLLLEFMCVCVLTCLYQCTV